MSHIKGVKLPRANQNLPQTNEEKIEIINNAAKAYEAFMDALKIDWKNDPHSSNTPMRVAKAWVNDIAAGCYNDPPDVTSFENVEYYDGMVFEGGIPVKSLCSHHHSAFIGRAHVAYLPSVKGRVIGLSKLNRIVEFYARRPQVQESLTMQIHSAIDKVCEDNKGVAVMISCQHLCACVRGVKHDGCEMKTSKLSGDFMTDSATRDEFYHFIANMNK